MNEFRVEDVSDRRDHTASRNKESGDFVTPREGVSLLSIKNGKRNRWVSVRAQERQKKAGAAGIKHFGSVDDEVVL